MTRPNHHPNNFANALKSIRRSAGISQEEFSLASSRTYVSTLERGLKTPTLNKVDELAEVLNVHPLTLLTVAYLKNPSIENVESLLARVQSELSDIGVFKQP